MEPHACMPKCGSMTHGKRTRDQFILVKHVFQFNSIFLLNYLLEQTKLAYRSLLY